MAFWDTVLGFEDRPTAIAWLVVFISMTVFVTARLPLLSEWGMGNFLPPGENFTLLSLKGRVFAHVITVFPWALLGGLQFVPMIRKLRINYHKVAGRVYLVLCVAISVSGAMLAPYGFGGDLSSQLATYTLLVAFVLCFTMGFVSIKRKRIQEHREWMLRSYGVGVAVMMIRAVLPLVSIVMPMAGDFYNTMSCEQLEFEIGSWNQTLEMFPLCGGKTQAIVKMNFESYVNVIAGFRLGYGPSTFISLMICGSIVEAWIYVKYRGGISDKVESA